MCVCVHIWKSDAFFNWGCLRFDKKKCYSPLYIAFWRASIYCFHLANICGMYILKSNNDLISLFNVYLTVFILHIWSWNSNTLATLCEELTHWKRLWYWEGLGAGGERDNRGWDGWMASPTGWTWVWVNSGSWWWTRRPGVLWFMGSQRVGHNWATELNWTDPSHHELLKFIPSHTM